MRTSVLLASAIPPGYTPEESELAAKLYAVFIKMAGRGLLGSHLGETWAEVARIAIQEAIAGGVA